MRPNQPPPPTASKRDSTKTVPSNGDSPPPPPPSTRPPPPPPPNRRDSTKTTTTDDHSVESEVTASTAGPRRPPKVSEIKTIPVERALQSVLEPGNLQEPINQSAHLYESKSSNPFDTRSADEMDTSNYGNQTYSTVSANSPSSMPTRNDTENPAYLTTSSRSEVETNSSKPLPLLTHGGLAPGEPDNLIYHKNTFSESWFFLFLIFHTVQFAMLLSAANAQLPSGVLAIILILVIAVLVLVSLARFNTRKSRLSSARNIKLRNGICTPEDEADDIADRAVYFLASACILEGIAYAIFAAVVAGRSSDLNSGGYYTQDTILQILRFASITLLALHRVIRPANRIDPMRTVLELEVVAICWDAIDGSTVYELLDGSTINANIAAAARVLMVVWYVSVGLRMALMFMTHLRPTAKGYGLLVTYPLQLAPQPTVDRTLQALRIRAIVIMTMALADTYAAIIRVILWAKGELNTLQQEMVLKNFLFIIACSSAYDMYSCTTTKAWNTRLLDFYFFTMRYPRREVQLEILRWIFVATYMIISISLTVVLINTTVDSDKWVANLVFDIILCLIFLIYCKNIYIKSDAHEPKWFFIPRQRFFTFPFHVATALGTLLASSLLGARIPGIYYNYDNMASSGVLWTYTNALLTVSLSIVPIAIYSLYWSTGYMLFRKEFTAVPGNYNAIHDPAIQMMATSTMTEGALDVLSCATLMELAENSLPGYVNGAVVLFCILEIFNACQCFALQVTLSGGHDDTPLDLVRWNAYLRTFRVLIDSGAIVLRLVLWIQYNAVSSVFLVKNIYNLIHTITQIERWKSVSHYPKETLFSQFVAPQEWYGLTNEQWRRATSETVAAQARSGRRV